MRSEPLTASLCTSDEWRLLIVDGHNSHFSMGFMQFCESHQIELFYLPPHTTHILQPLAVGLLGPLQHNYSRGIEDPHLRKLVFNLAHAAEHAKTEGIIQRQRAQVLE